MRMSTHAHLANDESHSGFQVNRRLRGPQSKEGNASTEAATPPAEPRRWRTSPLGGASYRAEEEMSIHRSLFDSRTHSELWPAILAHGEQRRGPVLRWVCVWRNSLRMLDTAAAHGQLSLSRLPTGQRQWLLCNTGCACERSSLAARCVQRVSNRSGEREHCEARILRPLWDSAVCRQLGEAGVCGHKGGKPR